MNPNSTGNEAHKADNEKVAEMLAATSLNEGMVAQSSEGSKMSYPTPDGGRTELLTPEEYKQYLENFNN